VNAKALAAARTKAMPEVKALATKYGRVVIASCLTRLAEAEKGAKKLEAMKREVAALEKRLSG
jgi:hypothetical protein